MTPRPLTKANATGNGSPAVEDLVQVQGALFAHVDSRIDRLATDMGSRFEHLQDRLSRELKESRADFKAQLAESNEAHSLDHSREALELTQWQTEQAGVCARRMQSFDSLNEAAVIANWIIAHRKAAISMALSALGFAALLGGFFLPGR